MRSIVELLIRCIHLIAAIVWFGGVFLYSYVAIPLAKEKLSAKGLLELHDRFRHAMRFTINILLLTGGIVIFIVAWNNDMQLKSEYMVYSAVKFGVFGLMALFWGLYSSLYRRHLEAVDPDNKIAIPIHVSILAHLTLLSGVLVFALSLLLRN